MDPRHLVQLATILEKGSMSQASQTLHLTQPTLTHNMQTLEMQAGGRLFERSRLGVRSTALGEMLAREGRAIARRLKDAHEAGARHRLGLRHQVRIGTGALIGAVLMPRLTLAMLEHHPDVAISLHSDRPHHLVDQLVDGQHDMAIGPSATDRPPHGIDRTLLVNDVLGVFCGPSHALARKTALAFGEADNQAWISLGVNSPFVRDALEMLTDVGVTSARTEITVVGEAMMLLRMLGAGRHLSVLPRYPVRALSHLFPLVELPLGVRPRPRPLYLWCRHALLEDPTFLAVKQTLEAVIHEG